MLSHEDEGGCAEAAHNYGDFLCRKIPQWNAALPGYSLTRCTTTSQMKIASRQWVPMCHSLVLSRCDLEVPLLMKRYCVAIPLLQSAVLFYGAYGFTLRFLDLFDVEQCLDS